MASDHKTTPPDTARLFSDPQPDAAPAGFHTAYVDGASRGNPGPASYAVVLQAPDGKTMLELGKYIGRETNNVAEYYGLITALDYATSHGIKRLRIRSDSELLVKQMQGSYKVKSDALRPLHERALKLSRMLEGFRIEHVPRERNREADRLANVALDRTGGPQVHSSASRAAGRDEPPATYRVRAHYVGGVFVPFEPIDLPDGTEVSFNLTVPKSKS